MAHLKPWLVAPTLTLLLAACSESDSSTAPEDDSGGGTGTLPAAYAEFDADNVTVTLDGDEIVVETNGRPNHTSPYWSSPFHQGQGNPTEAHPLFVEPTVTSYDDMAPGFIDDFVGTFTLRVPASPTLANNSSATGLGPIGISVSGAVIYNDEEGPGVPLDNAAPSLDYSGAHTGPQSYHYHLEPTAWSEDDTALIGVMSDGFLLYGRKCASTGTYPTDLDASGGHTGTTQHSDEPHYHYHIENETYLGEYYILFPGNYQGTPNGIQ